MTVTTLPKVSDANTFMNCKGSYRAQQAFPSTPGEVSQSQQEGLICHAAAQKLFKGEAVTDVAPELLEAATEYYDEVIQYCTAHGVPLADLHVESRQYVPGYSGWYGIPDAWCVAFIDGLKVLKIWDAKFGHRIVDPFEHWPMIIYGFSIVEAFQVPPDIIEPTVVQPRAFAPGGTVRKWAMTYDELVMYRRQVNDTMIEVVGSKPPCTTGTWCKTCNARAGCDTLQQVSYDGLDFVSDMSTHNLTGHSLGVELRLLRRAEEMIKARLSGLEEQALYELREGKHVTFFDVTSGTGRERWRKGVPTEQIIMMGNMLGVDCRKPVELDTPAQLKKKGIDPAVIAEYSEKPPTGLKLVEVTEKDVAQIFNR